MYPHLLSLSFLFFWLSPLFLLSPSSSLVSASSTPTQQQQLQQQHHQRQQEQKILYASHYTGYIYTLTLTLDSNTNTNSHSHSLTDSPSSASLRLTSSLRTCGALPSWLTFDAVSRTLFCSDEAFEHGANGSLTALAAASDGSLVELVRTETRAGGVASVLYEGDDGGRKKYIAIAHYQGSALSTFALPLTPNASALQTFEYTLPQPGPIPSRQDAPHPHAVFLDPTGEFVLSPDLGADVVRVYAIDKTSGMLRECDALAVKPGDGPRHGVFWTSTTTQSQSENQASPLLYIVNELANTVTAYAVSYSSSCLSFEPVQVVTPYPTGTAIPRTANVGEIRLQGGNVYVSIRNDEAFPPSSDSMATLTVSNETGGLLAFRDLTPSYGKTPRTFVINKAGDLVAIGDQVSSNVAIVRRDPKTGKLGALLAILQVGSPGTVGESTGLSSVVWDE
ncbi:hypothetical protein VTN77DRAFT_6543 [Rasamsonia byssochlamydoides]|uniref:uncharacterized protein n=1 Tax=Rasamsonia byssochlamydoides TaxID=89139 RepID=UPI0037427E22